ncbi:MAG: hypothetical protein EOM88_03710 [Clostridia bacterium]|nr:hypothetical protein [Clostridia bacterium]
MKKELIFPLIAGLIIGVLIMLFWQLNTRIINTGNRLAQLEQATVQNSQALTEVVSFINQASGQAQAQPEVNPVQ